MKITLIYNAVDSLQVAMRSFRAWNLADTDMEEVRNLKIAIEFLHNAMELFLKALLLEEDEESIYCEGQEKLIEKAKEKAQKDKISLAEYLLKEDKIKTFSYNELLKKYFESEPWRKSKTKKCLEKLGHYRNRIMHFGIDVNEDLVDLLSVIYESFNVILEDSFYERLLGLTNYFSYSDVIDTIEPWSETYEEYLRSVAVGTSGRKINIFTEKVNSMVVSSKFKTFLQHYNIIMKDMSIYSADEIRWEFEYNEKKIQFTTIYDAFYNCSILAQDCYSYPMIFCVIHSKNKICMYEKWRKYEEFGVDDIYDEGKNDEKKCYKIKPLTENNMRDCLISALKKTILCNTWEPEEY